MSKTTFILLNHRTAWVGAGESGTQPVLKSLQKIDLASLTTVEEQAAAICEALSQERLAKKSVVLVLGPQQTEYRPFQVPAVGAAELPIIVANLAATQMTKVDDDSIIDFVAMPVMNSGSNGNAGATSVLVMATSFQTNLLLSELKTKGLTFARILPRLIVPNLLRDSAGSDVQVMVHVLGSEIDFVATQAKQVVMVRSSVIPAEGDDRGKLIARETSRSLAVLSAEFGRTEKMNLGVIASTDDAAAVTGAIAAQDLTGHKLAAVDFGTLPAGFDSQNEAYATLALAALRLDRKPLLDLANPTRPPQDNAWKRKLYLSAMLAATVLLGLLGLAWLEIRKLDQQLADLQADVDNRKVAEVSDKQTINRVGAINQFVAMDVAPLPLLETLSQQLPYGEEMRVQSLKLNVGRLASEESFPVVMTTRLKSADLAEVYKPKLQTNPEWAFNPAPQLTDKASKYYTKTAIDTITVKPDFETVYERLANAVLGAQPQEAPRSVPAVETDAAEEEVLSTEERGDSDANATDDQDATDEAADEESDDTKRKSTEDTESDDTESEDTESDADTESADRRSNDEESADDQDESEKRERKSDDDQELFDETSDN
jgi:hypothetical protein